jgi:ribosomal protein S12 methylthiotransferase
MTGFPGETAAGFARLLADIKRMKFDHLGVFAYSPEEGTAGALMKGRVPVKVAEARAKKIIAEQKKIWTRKAKSMIGQELPALVVSPGVARLESQAPDVDGVVRLAPEDATIAPVGEFVLVRLVSVNGYDFNGELV